MLRALTAFFRKLSLFEGVREFFSMVADDIEIAWKLVKVRKVHLLMLKYGISTNPTRPSQYRVGSWRHAVQKIINFYVARKREILKRKFYNDKRLFVGCYVVRERFRKRFEVTKDGYEIEDAGELELH